MTGFEQRWIAAVLSGFAGGHSVLAPTHVEWVTTFRSMRASSTRLASFGLRIALWLVALAPLWRFERLGTIARLSPERRGELLAALLAHRFRLVRELATLLKLVATMAMFTSSEARRFVGHIDRDEREVASSGERIKPYGIVVQLRPRRQPKEAS